MRVINLLPHGPAYELLSPQKAPLHEWPLPDGNRVAIVNREWPGALGRWVRAVEPSWHWEVWQPDTRADRVYTHTFEDGVVHRLFPAQERAYRPGALRPVRAVCSETLLAHLGALDGGPQAILLHGFGAPLWYEVLECPGCRHKPGIYLISHGAPKAPLQTLPFRRHPLSILSCLVEQVRAMHLYGRLSGVTHQNAPGLAAVRMVYRGPVSRLTMGCDFAFWVPVLDRDTKQAIRARLGIPAERTLFVAATRFEPCKQLDRLLIAFRELGQRDDYTLLLLGQGDAEYVRALQRLAGPLLTDGKAIFHPYATRDVVRQILWAADVLVSASSAEGGPVAVMEAVACGLPVLTTPVGRAFEVMQQEGKGAVLPRRRFRQWPRVIRSILEQGLPQPLDREIARRSFDWRQVAASTIRLLDGAGHEAPAGDA